MLLVPIINRCNRLGAVHRVAIAWRSRSGGGGGAAAVALECGFQYSRVRLSVLSSMAFSTHITRRLSPAEVFRKRTKSTTYSAEMWYLSTAQYYEYPMWYLPCSTVSTRNHCGPTADHRATGCSIHRLSSMREAVLTAGLAGDSPRSLAARTGSPTSTCASRRTACTRTARREGPS